MASLTINRTSSGSAVRRAMSALLDTRLSGVCLVIALLILWELSVRLDIVQSANWPTFSAVVAALVRDLMTGELAVVIGSTLWVMLRGYVLGCALGIAVGFAIALWRPMRLTVEPAVDILRTIPTTAIIPPLIFIFGLGDSLKIFAIVFAVIFPMALNTIGGMAAVDPTYLQVARTFGLPRLRVFFRVLFPATLPYIFAGLRTSLALALIVTVVSEMIAGSGGIGYYLLQMQYALRPADMYGAIVLLTVVAYALNRIFVYGEGKLIRWARTREASWSDT